MSGEVRVSWRRLGDYVLPTWTVWEIRYERGGKAQFDWMAIPATANVESWFVPRHLSDRSDPPEWVRRSVVP